MEEASDLSDTHIQTNSSLPKEKLFGNRYVYNFHGFWFPETYLIKTTQKVLETFKPLDNDTILASFPKTGSTWLKSLLHSIVHSPKTHENHQNPLTLNHPQELVPSLETVLYFRDQKPEETMKQLISVEDLKNARIFSTHIPYQIFGDILNSSKCKIVYVTRNPKDTLISMWHFKHKSVLIKDDAWELKAAVDHFCNGIVPFGDYYEHVLAYREESMKRPEKVLFVTYEELKENPKNHVRKIAEFLGCPFGEGDDEEIDEIVKVCSFGSLSGQEVNKSSEVGKGFQWAYSSFFRKGEIGDYVNYLDDEMIGKIDGITKKKFHGNGFVYGV